MQIVKEQVLKLMGKYPGFPGIIQINDIFVYEIQLESKTKGYIIQQHDHLTETRGY